MRPLACVLVAALLHAALIVGTRRCEVGRAGAPAEIGVVVVPAAEAAKVEPPAPRERVAGPAPVEQPAPPPVRKARPKPRAGGVGASPVIASAAAMPALGARDVEEEGDVEVAMSDAAVGTGSGMGLGAGAGGGVGDGDEDGELPAGCRAEDFRGIWVVDDQDRLAAFDPETNQFRLLGLLRCKPRTPYEKYTDEWEAHPFSMAVDRAGRAWVLYTSGELFKVSLSNLSCSPTNWAPGRSKYELFALGFVADAAGRERLYIAGGPVSDLGRAEGRVAALALDSLEPTSLGPYPRGDFSPELTGTADGRLFGFYPGQKLVHIDPRTGGAVASWPLPSGEGSGVKAWAFAHWGGAFYLFASATGGGNRVYRFDPGSERLETVVERAPYRIVGAGVSTCAPVNAP
jgi:hypothetical protein